MNNILTTTAQQTLMGIESLSDDVSSIRFVFNEKTGEMYAHRCRLALPDKAKPTGQTYITVDDLYVSPVDVVFVCGQQRIISLRDEVVKSYQDFEAAEDYSAAKSAAWCKWRDLCAQFKALIEDEIHETTNVQVDEDSEAKFTPEEVALYLDEALDIADDFINGGVSTKVRNKRRGIQLIVMSMEDSKGKPWVRVVYGVRGADVEADAITIGHIARAITSCMELVGYPGDTLANADEMTAHGLAAIVKADLVYDDEGYEDTLERATDILDRLRIYANIQKFAEDNPSIFNDMDEVFGKAAFVGGWNLYDAACERVHNWVCEIIDQEKEQ